MRPARPDDFRLPDLRFVPVDSLIPHERHDLQRMAPLLAAFRGADVLKNPPVVAELDPPGTDRPRYMVLDGANRCTAAAQTGLPHMVVQVAHYEDPWVHLSTWHHALSGMTAATLAESCSRIPGLECRSEPLLHARAQLARREVLAYAAHAGPRVLAFHGGATLEEHNSLLNAIVDLYRESYRFYRTSTEAFEVAHERHPDADTLVVFPHFEPAEVMELAGSGAKLPAGITRHLIRFRALRVNVPIARMADTSISIEEKNAWLTAWAERRFVERHVRFYEEPTVLFDE